MHRWKAHIYWSVIIVRLKNNIDINRSNIDKIEITFIGMDTPLLVSTNVTLIETDALEIESFLIFCNKRIHKFAVPH